MTTLLAFMTGLMVLVAMTPSILLASGAGTTGASILKLGIGARGLGMGEAYSAVGTGVEALYWNPANLVEMERPELMITHNPLVDEVGLNQVAFAFRAGRFVLGGGFQSIGQDPIDSYDEAGNRIGDFKASDQVSVFGLGTEVGSLRVGLASKFYRSEIADVSASGVAFDAGVHMRNPIWIRLNHALVVRNMGSSVSFLQQEDDLPLTFLLGNAFKLNSGLIFSLDVGSIKGPGGVVAFGTEWRPFHKTSDFVGLRGGYTTRRNKAEKLSGASFGLGLNVKQIDVDYAWIPFGELGDSHALTLKWRMSKFSLPFTHRSKKEEEDLIQPSPTEGTARPAQSGDYGYKSVTGSVIITLRGGQHLRGEIVPSKLEDAVILKTKTGTIKIPNSDIFKMRRTKKRKKSLQDIK